MTFQGTPSARIPTRTIESGGNASAGANRLMYFFSFREAVGEGGKRTPTFSLLPRNFFSLFTPISK
jgi:hypothetical protein